MLGRRPAHSALANEIVVSEDPPRPAHRPPDVDMRRRSVPTSAQAPIHAASKTAGRPGESIKPAGLPLENPCGGVWIPWRAPVGLRRGRASDPTQKFVCRFEVGRMAGNVQDSGAVLSGGGEGGLPASRASSSAPDHGEADGAHRPGNGSSSDMGGARKRALTFLKRHDAVIAKFLPVLLDSMAPVDTKSSKQLLKRLSSSVTDGEAPSFADPGARSGYARRRMKHRSAQVGIVLLHPALAPVRAALEDGAAGAFCVASIGGGPGSDAVGLLSTRDFLERSPPHNPAPPQRPAAYPTACPDAHPCAHEPLSAFVRSSAPCSTSSLAGATPCSASAPRSAPRGTRHAPRTASRSGRATSLGCPPPPPFPSPGTNRTRRVPHPVLIGHAASLTPY